MRGWLRRAMRQFFLFQADHFDASGNLTKKVTRPPSPSVPTSFVKLAKLTIREAAETVDVTSGVTVYDVHDPHALVQAAGYIKYVLGTKRRSAVLYRGQATLYPSLCPTLYRGITSHAAQSRREGYLHALVQKAQTVTPMLGKLRAEIVECLFQHYGLRTSWIDVVDNIWIALWFACHRVRFSGGNGEFLHFERRIGRKELPDTRFAYVVLIEADFLDADSSVAGRWFGSTTEMLDLRIAAPSLFLRPHAQHGLLFRQRGTTIRRPVNYWPSVAGVLRVSLEDALDWLGNGALLNAHALFPPPSYDEGYRILLKDWSQCGEIAPRLIGTLAHIGT